MWEEPRAREPSRKLCWRRCRGTQSTGTWLPRIQRSTVVNHRIALWLAVPALLLLGGCHRNGGNGSAAGTPSARTAAPVIDQATAGSISGVVHFNGKAPERIKIDMSADPA